MTRIGKLLSIGTAALALTACSSSEDPRNKPKVDIGLSTVPSNDATLSASDTGTLLTEASSLSGLTGTSFGVVLMGAADAGGNLGVKALVARAAAARKQVPVTVAGVLQTARQSCPVSGTLTLNVEDADGDAATTTSGDYVEIIADDCVMDDGTGLDGSMRLQFTSSGGDFVTDPADPYFDPYASSTFSFTITLHDFTEWLYDGTFAAMDGAMTITWSQDATANTISSAITGPYIITAQGDSSGTITAASGILEPSYGAGYSFVGTETYDDAFTAVSEDAFAVNAKVCSTEEGGCLTVTMNPAMAQRVADLHPYAGNLRFEVGIQYLQLDVVDTTTVHVSYFIGGVTYNGTATWSCLDTAADSSTCFVADP